MKSAQEYAHKISVDAMLRQGSTVQTVKQIQIDSLIFAADIAGKTWSENNQDGSNIKQAEDAKAAILSEARKLSE
jgi:hypothetical protein